MGRDPPKPEPIFKEKHRAAIRIANGRPSGLPPLPVLFRRAVAAARPGQLPSIEQLGAMMRRLVLLVRTRRKKKAGIDAEYARERAEKREKRENGGEWVEGERRMREALRSSRRAQRILSGEVWEDQDENEAAAEDEMEDEEEEGEEDDGWEYEEYEEEEDEGDSGGGGGLGGAQAVTVS
ncbi:hypothetical protein BDZ45DRAFT_684873 [Acephala macrosclerotiorum]|nr:hypothetical protein BDZ45DRAFT_684873 [Acephala macrosclerotiorum]